MKVRYLFRRKMVAGFVLFLLISVNLVRAGGWAVVTLSSLPEQVMAQRPLTIEFAVRGHGRELVDELSPIVTAVHPETGDKIFVEATPASKKGHYEATLNFPQAGSWEWVIDPFGYEHTMPPLLVQPEAVFAPVVGTKTTVGFPEQLPSVAMVGGLVGTAVAFLFWLQNRKKERLSIAILFLLITITSGFLWRIDDKSQTVQASSEIVAAIPQEQMGEAMFVAKGCINCHQHGGVNMADNLVQIGPNLTNYDGNPDYLSQWLQNPSEIKPETDMPSLNLTEKEIQILVEFLE